MVREYIENVKVLNITPLDILGATAVVTVKVRDFELECFVSDFKVRDHFILGEECAVKFLLLPWPDSFMVNKKLEYIKNLRRSGTPVHCDLSGRIVDIFFDKFKDRKYLVIFCGIFVTTLKYEKWDVSIGDFISIEGRLDITKA